MNAIYPGSFDPVTNGHIDIAIRGAKVMGNLVVAVLDNPHKTPLFTAKERVMLLKEVFIGHANIQVDLFSGLLIDYAKTKGIHTIVRGIRSPEDMAKEAQYAVWNRQLSSHFLDHDTTCANRLSNQQPYQPPNKPPNKFETIYLTADPKLVHISGSIVKEVAAILHNSSLDDSCLSQAVPTVVLRALRDKFDIK